MTTSRAIISEIAEDNLSGAADIYSKALTYFQVIIDENNGESSDNLRNALRNSCRELLSAQSEMAPLYNLVAEIMGSVRDAENITNSRERVVQLLDRLKKQHESSAKELTDRAVQALSSHRTIMTISYSSAVRDFLLSHPARESITVIIPESRPMCEGVRLAESLGREGLHVTLITDMAAGTYVEKCDLFVCGADAVTEDYLVNKIGTGLIAGAMTAAGKETVALFAENKMMKADIFRYSPMSHPGSEISEAKLPNCEIENVYFEKCPLQHFSRFISDNNEYTTETLPGRIREIVFPDDLF